MKQLNRTRLAAGLPIDPKLEIERPGLIDAAAVDGMIAKALRDAGVFNTITEGAATSCPQCKKVHQLDPDFQAAQQLKTTAASLSESNPSSARDQAAAAAIHWEKFTNKASTLKCNDCANGVVRDPKGSLTEEVELSSCPDCKQVQQNNGDYKAAWKLKVSANQLKRDQPELAQGQANLAKLHMREFEAKLPQLKCAKCKGVTESTQLDEFVVGMQPLSSWEKDDKQPTNVVAKGPTLGDSPDEENESPEQLRKNLDNDPDNQPVGDGRKVTVPARIKSLINDEIKSAKEAAERCDFSQREGMRFYNDLANMFEDLLRHLDGGTVYDLKQAQIFMTSLMGPMLHKIPADVVNFIARGGERASLSSYMKNVNVNL